MPYFRLKNKHTNKKEAWLPFHDKPPRVPSKWMTFNMHSYPDSLLPLKYPVWDQWSYWCDSNHKTFLFTHVRLPGLLSAKLQVGVTLHLRFGKKKAALFGQTCLNSPV